MCRSDFAFELLIDHVAYKEINHFGATQAFSI